MPDNVRMMRTLEVGAKLVIRPDPGESLESASKRIKLRASKHRREGRSYRVSTDKDAVLVERVEFGRNRKVDSWESLKTGESALVYPGFTEQQKRKLQNRLQYVHNCGDSGVFEIRELGRDLYVRCMIDRSGTRPKAPDSTPRTQKDNWLSQAALARLSAAHDRKEAKLAGLQTARGRWLTSTAEAMDEHAERYAALAANWRPPAVPIADMRVSLASPTLHSSGQAAADGVVISIPRHDKTVAGHFRPPATESFFFLSSVPRTFRPGSLILDHKNVIVRHLRRVGIEPLV